MTITKIICHEGCLFFSGIFSYFSLAEARRIWDTPAEAKKQFSLYERFKRDEMLFYMSVGSVNQQRLVRWYNDKASQSDLSHVLQLHASQANIDLALEFFQTIRRNIETICQELWPDNSEHYLNRWERFMHRPWSYYQNLDPDNQALIRHWYDSYQSAAGS